jgi:mono/diheme cytochrome c family protein
MTFLLFAVIMVPFLAADICDAADKARKYPNWVEMHMRLGIIDEKGTGEAQQIAKEDLMQVFQARKPDRLNPQTCVDCHGKGGTGTWLYGNPEYYTGAVRWTPAEKYEKTAAEKVEIKRQRIHWITVSEDN